MNSRKNYQPVGFEAYTPEQIFHKVQEYTEYQMVMPVHKQIMLGIVAGGYIGLGCIFYVFLSASESGANLLFSGLAFSSGYIIAILAGAEVFTTNNLQAMSWASGKISSGRILQRWSLVLLSNATGALGLAIVVLLSAILVGANIETGKIAFSLAQNHTNLGFVEIFFRAVLGNLFICISIWITFAGRTVIDKLIPMALIISAVPILNLEHIVASLFYIPLGLLMYAWHPEIFGSLCDMTFNSVSIYLSAVILGNIIGGSGIVALVYYVVYRG